MITLAVQFLQEQGMVILMGWMLVAGILHQVVSIRRYRRLQGVLRSINGTGHSKTENKRGEGAVISSPSMPAVHISPTDSEMDAQLQYLKQSLDRIAAGRDQKLEEEVREKRKLTPQQESIIAEILREYLA